MKRDTHGVRYRSGTQTKWDTSGVHGIGHTRNGTHRVGHKWSEEWNKHVVGHTERDTGGAT